MNAALAPWTAWLAGLAPHAAATYGPWMPRLASALGPRYQGWLPEIRGEPEGWDGLAARGPWDRLLASEWLLADELPDEFVRRAAAGEQLFVRLARREPRRSPWCVALCDVGPDQLGAPRLAQYALLAALAFRRGPEAPLRVAALQKREEPLPALDPWTGRLLAGARTRRPPDARDLRWWHERLEHLAKAQGADFPEVWLVGGDDLAALAWPGANRAKIAEGFEDECSGALRVSLQRAGRGTTHVALPPPPHGANLALGDPFAAPTVALTVARNPGTRHAVFGRSAHLFVRSGNAIELWATPKGRRAPRLLATDVRQSAPFAAGRYDQRLQVLWHEDGALYLSAPHGGYPLAIPPGFQVPDPTSALTWAHFPAFGAAFTTDAADQVWYLDFRPGHARATPLGRADSPLLPLDSHAQFLEAGVVRILERAGELRSISVAGALPTPTGRALPGGRRMVAYEAEGLWFAARRSDYLWAATPLAPTARAVVGLTGTPDAPAWLLRDDDAITHLHADGSSTTWRLQESGIKALFTDPDGAALAVVTERCVRFYDPMSGLFWGEREVP